MLVLSDEQNALDAKQWWAKQRYTYNRGLIISGIYAFLLYVSIVGIWSYRLPCLEISVVTTFFQMIVYALIVIIANGFYMLGFYSEILLRPTDPIMFRTKMFLVGFWFSVTLPFLAPLAAAYIAWAGSSSYRCY